MWVEGDDPGRRLGREDAAGELRVVGVLGEAEDRRRIRIKCWLAKVEVKTRADDAGAQGYPPRLPPPRGGLRKNATFPAEASHQATVIHAWRCGDLSDSSSQ